jgi:serine/threonine-protein kinase
MLETLGDYTILDSIGSGTMGQLYRARDTRYGRTVAIRVVDPAISEDADRRQQFLADARAAAALSHPNIAALYEIGEAGDRLYLACEYVPGQPLASEIGGRPMNRRRAVHLAVQIADALADAHSAGIVHGRLCSRTIVVTPKGNAKLLDVGLTGWTTSAPAKYLAPELTNGTDAGDRTDIFSMAVVLHEMLTGRMPADGRTFAAAVKPPALGDLLRRALAGRVEDRCQSAAVVAAELRAIDLG